MRKLFLFLTLVVLVAMPAVVEAAVKKPGAFTLVSPAGGAVINQNRPTFQWNQAARAASYQLRIKNKNGRVVSNTSFTTSQANCGTSGCSVVSPFTFTSGKFTWQVIARNAGGTQASKVRALTYQAPLTGTVAEQMLTLVNLKRCAAGLKPLALESRLTNAAQGHSTRMAQLNFFSHNDPHNGSTMVTRVNAAGYPWTNLGENIAAGNATAQATFTQWWNSTGHRKNMMNSQMREMGLGYATGGTYGHYWTMVVGNRSGAAGGVCP